MKYEDLQQLTNNMQEKLGQEHASVISDDLATILADNTTMNTTISTKDAEIAQLKKDKEQLISANSNLMLKITTGLEEPFVDRNENKKVYNMSDSFDSKGNFK